MSNKSYVIEKISKKEWLALVDEKLIYAGTSLIAAWAAIIIERLNDEQEDT